MTTLLSLNYKDSCLEKVGKIAKDANICDRIEKEYNRDKCFSKVAEVTNKKALCENVENSRDECYKKDKEDTIKSVKDGSLDEYEIEDWAVGNMDWGDFKGQQIKVSGAPPPLDFQQGWSDGKKSFSDSV